MMKKRILFVVYSLNIGGLERIVVNLANVLDYQRYEPYICCIATAGEFAEEFSYPDNLFVIGNTGRINVRSCRFIYNIIKKFNIDIVHSHNLAGLLYSFPTAKLLRIPLIHTNHGYLEEERGNRTLLFFEKWMSGFLDRYICVSDRLRSDVAGRLHVEKEKLMVLYNGIDIDSIGATSNKEKEDHLVIGSVGSLNSIKNYRLLIEAFSDILVHHPECRLELIGDGSERAELDALCDRLDLNEKVFFRGNVRNPLNYVAGFNVFALTSLSEGLSVSILEAIGMKKICVVSRVGGNPEIITDGKNGFLFESNNRQDCVRKILHVIDNINSEDMASVRNAAGNTVKDRFSLESMSKQYCAIYDGMNT